MKKKGVSLGWLPPARMHQFMAIPTEHFQIIRQLMAEAHIAEVMNVNGRMRPAATLTDRAPFSYDRGAQRFPARGFNVFLVAMPPRFTLFTQKFLEFFREPSLFPLPTYRWPEKFVGGHLIKSVHRPILLLDGSWSQGLQ